MLVLISSCINECELASDFTASITYLNFDPGPSQSQTSWEQDIRRDPKMHEHVCVVCVNHTY